jgi:hypothetical protein
MISELQILTYLFSTELAHSNGVNSDVFAYQVVDFPEPGIPKHPKILLLHVSDSSLDHVWNSLVRKNQSPVPFILLWRIS